MNHGPTKLTAFIFLLLAACTAAPDDDARSEGAESVETGESAATRARWYLVKEAGGKLKIQEANGTSLRCADGKLDVRCSVGRIDLSALKLSPAAVAAVAGRYANDTMMVYGTTATYTDQGKSVFRVNATKAYESLLNVFPEGSIFAYTKLQTPVPCTLAYMEATPGVVAPMKLLTRPATCGYRVVKLNSAQSFNADAPLFEELEPWVPSGSTEDLVDDLERGDTVLVEASLMSMRNVPFEAAEPNRAWRDVRHLYGP